LGRKARLPEARVWFSLLGLLYLEGTPLAPAVEAFRLALKTYEEEDIQAFCEAFPQRSSLILLLFFLPAAFALMFYPLLAELLKAQR
jgi:hypothetical protein